MSTDPLNAAVGRIDAAIAGDAPVQSALGPPRDLAELAAALGRVEALIAAGAAAESDGSAAAERIADIAFVLHEREVEPSLCDALDAAVREISDASALKRASAERAQQAAELLRELSRRVNEMAVLSQAEPGAEAAGSADANARDDDGDEEASGDDIPRAGLFDEDVPEDDDFAQVVAALAAALPSLADLEELPDPAAESAGVAAVVPDAAQAPDAPTEAQADEARAAEGEAEGPIFAPDVETTLIVGSSRSVLVGGEAVLPEPPGEEVPAEDAPVSELAAVQVPDEQAAAGMQGASFTPAPSSDAANDALSNEPGMTDALVAEQALSGGAPEDPLPISNQVAAIDAAGESALQDSTIQDEVLAEESVAHEPRVSAPAAQLETSPQLFGEAPPTDNAASMTDTTPVGDETISTLALPAPDDGASALVTGSAQPAERVEAPVAQNPETQPEAPLPVEPTVETDGEVETFAQPAMAEEGARLVAEAEASRALLPEPPPIGPEDDPGDLFEPIPEAPKVTLPESEMTLAVPEPSTVAEASQPPHVADIEADSTRKPMPELQPTASAAESGIADAKTAAEISAPVLSSSAEQDAKLPEPAAAMRPRQRAVANVVAPRSVTNDPLAPVRALSEEEMIALFS